MGAILIIIIQMLVLGIVIYLSVRLALRHELGGTPLGAVRPDEDPGVR